MSGMKAGTTFLLAKEHQAIDDHLWIIISDAEQFPQQVVIVNVTTIAPEKDQACIIERNEHPLVTHPSCISYAHAKMVTLNFLLERKDRGSIAVKDSIS